VKQTVRNPGDGEVRIHGSGSRLRNSDAAPPGNHSNQPRIKKNFDLRRIDRLRSRSRQLQSDGSGVAEKSVKTGWASMRHNHIRPDRPVV
jgi:hypothetical protein